MMTDAFPPTDDMSPALGGSRAIADEPAPIPEPQAPSAAGPGPSAVIEELFGAEGAEVFQALGALGALVGLGEIVGQAVSSLETQLPQAIAAFGELFEELGQAVEQALEGRDDEA